MTRLECNGLSINNISREEGGGVSRNLTFTYRGEGGIKEKLTISYQKLTAFKGGL